MKVVFSSKSYCSNEQAYFLAHSVNISLVLISGCAVRMFSQDGVIKL